ncbi:sensor domain-containing diguanylate cyclase [Planococcus sp. APC 3906]|uniref:sensor domain-containing diguanylate cyclase n=1 Tax=Planococcus sp. APC 3906 TaxID=3035194 RepID=UPI0025B34AE2|nr:sensor domain-containing diguanylate cyclase [Planococcus sp. APC 3906]MDN3449167.1 sensor domain-containing diguanylate cyclase [Planococcus sp. APC 3906]
MAVTKKRSIILWLLWIAIVPLGLYLVYQHYPPPEIDLWNITAFTVLAILTALMPLNINGTPMYLVQCVTIAVFLKYGLFAEIILSQLTVLILLFRSRSDEPRHIRLPFNSLMFFVVSAIAGIAYMEFGGEIGSTVITHILIFGLIYEIISILSNHLFLYMDDMFMGVNKSFFSLDTVWDFAITLLVFPYAITLYITEAYIGATALFLLGIPFLMIAGLLRMYSSSEKVNIDLKKAGEIGHQLAARLSTDEVLDQFVIQVTKMFRLDYTYVIDYRDGELQMLRMFENDEFIKNQVPPVRYNKGIAGNVIVSGTPVIYDKKSEWDDIVTGYVPVDAESIMCTPIARNNKIEGVLLVASRKKFAFAAHQLKILDILSTYFAVSLEKAGYVQRAIATSERCGLTQLYNYRYLDEKLEKSMQKVKSGEIASLSLIMMDIDHFKSINDTYGHQSGNDILVELANMIREEVGSEGTVARYGGEEFVVMFENYGKEFSMLFAENLRKRIEQHEFLIQSDLDSERSVEKVHITLSIGVSTAPDDSDEPNALIRNADRALYIGAKQAGRNKVAAYAK